MIEKYLISENKSVKDVVSHMQDNAVKAVIIINENKIVLGLFTLGDMRHFFLTSGNLSANIKEAMNPNPILFYNTTAIEQRQKTNKLVIYPLVDKDKKIIQVITDDNDKNIISNTCSDIPLVIMAGGKGSRLYPYTKILPKALIPIGDYTISERIIQNFEKYGCKDVFFILNHKANMIESYFNDIERSYSINYVIEKNFLGTGGGLALLKGKINKTFILSNCDILVDADIESLYKMHKSQKNIITFICAMKNVVIPYGIVETDSKGHITKLKEKPEFSFLTNTGVYIIEPEVINDLNENEFINLPDIAKRYLDNGQNVGVFPVSEKAWLDMGQLTEMENMINKLGVQ